MKRILIIDDERTVVDVLSEGFKKFENIFITDSAYTGEEAIELIKKNRYDLVISDIRLPGKSGIDVLIELKKLQPEAGFIAMTAFSSPDIKEKVKEFGGLEYIEKPFSFKMLKEFVLNYLKEESGVRGVVESVQLTSILQLMNMEKKTCVLWIDLDGNKGYLAFNEGEIVDAKYGTLKGIDAAKFLIQRNEGEIRIDTKKKPKKRTINIPFMNLLLDSMKEKDEKDRDDSTELKKKKSTKINNPLPELKERLKKELEYLSDIKGFINAGFYDSSGKCIVEFFEDDNKSFKNSSPMLISMFNQAQKMVYKVGFGVIKTVQVSSERGVLFVNGLKFDSYKLIFILYIGLNGNVGMAKKKLDKLLKILEEDLLDITM